MDTYWMNDYENTFNTAYGNDWQKQYQQSATPQSGGGWQQWLGNNWQDLLGTGLNAYLGYSAAQDQQKAAKAAAQPQTQYGYSGVDLGMTDPYFQYFLNEIPALYQYMQGKAGRGAPQVRGPGGMSSGLARDMADYARAEDPRLNAAGDWMTSMFNQAPNQWMQEAYDTAKGGPIADYINAAMGVAFGGGGGGGPATYGYKGGGGGGGFQGAGPGRFENMMYDFANPIFKDPTSNPLYDRLNELGTRNAEESWANTGANLARQQAAAGMLTSSGAMRQNALNTQALGQGVYDAGTAAMMELLNQAQQAAGQGGGWENSRINTNTGAAASVANANTAAGASRYATDQALRQQMAGLGLQAILGQQGAMSGLGNDWAGYQMAAAGLLPGYHDIKMSDLERAFGANMSLDQMRMQASQANAANAARRENAPWENLQRAMGLMMPFADLYGVKWNQAQMPGQYLPAMSDMAGFLGGALQGAGATGLINWDTGKTGKG